MENSLKILRSQDIQTGLQDYQIHEFDNLLLAGWAARLALHLRGRDTVQYQILKELSAILFGVPKQAFKNVIYLLQSTELITLLDDNQTILPNIPYFDDLYDKIGGYVTLEEPLNDFEECSLKLLDITSKAPITRTIIQKELGVTEKQLDKLLITGRHGSYIENIVTKNSGQILVSPLYFSENPSEIAELVSKHGSDSVKRILELIRANPGWPLSVIQQKMKINNENINGQELDFLESLIIKKIVQPPTIQTNSKEVFIFTPKVGNEQIPVIEKEIYEKAMAIISCVRYGQHFTSFKVKYPRAIINSLKRDGWLKPTSSAKDQYRTLALFKICKIIPHPSWNGYHEVHLIKTKENYKALDIALNLMDNHEILNDRGIDQTAIDVITGNLQYKEFLRSYNQIHLKKQIPELQPNLNELDLLIEELQKGW